MARGKKPAVSLYERKRWLEELEKGKGITGIARAAGRDIRVVKRHIEIASYERAAAQARSDFLLGRIELHQEDLLSEVRRLREVMKGFPPHPLEPGEPLQRKVHEALKEHTKRLLLPGLLDSYRQMLEEYQESRNRVSAEVAAKEAELVSSLPAEVHTDAWAPSLVKLSEEDERLIETGRSYSENEEENSMYRPRWGAYNLVRSPVTKSNLAPVLDAHRKFVLESEPCLLELQEHRRRLRELNLLISEELDAFLVKRLIPGRCRYCPL